MTIRRVTGGNRAVSAGLSKATKMFISYPASAYKTAAVSSVFAATGPIVLTTTANKMYVVNPSGRAGLSLAMVPGFGTISNLRAKYEPGYGFFVAIDSVSVDGIAWLLHFDWSGSLVWYGAAASTVAGSAQLVNCATSANGVYFVSERNNILCKASLTDGSTLWANAGGVGFVSIATDWSDNVYTASNTAIHKVNGSGTWQWTRTISGGTPVISQIAVDKATGNVAVVYTATTVNTWVVALINSSGTLQWVRALGGTTPLATGVAFDSAGSVYSMASGTSGASYIAKWDSSGTLQYQKSITATGFATANRLSIDASDSLCFYSGAVSQSLIYRVPTSMPAGAYVCNGITSTIATSALATATPAHTLTTSTPTVTSVAGITSYPASAGSFISTGLEAPVVMTDTYRSGVRS